MRFESSVKKVSSALLAAIFLASVSLAQEPTPPENPQKNEPTKSETKTPETPQPKSETVPAPTQPSSENKSGDKSEAKPENEIKEESQDKTGDDKKKGNETLSDEEAAILPYYTNYLREYHLGPDDVISVDVFGQPNYSRAGITVPPNAKIGYPLIPGGIFVAGKTTEQVAAEIAKKLDEYIIDPQVTVTLEKVGSARFAILGKVGAPGIRLMTRRYNLYEAVIEAGGIAQGGDRKKVLLVRRDPAGGYSQTVYSMDELLSGKKEMPYLVPGDQVIVPEKKWSMTKVMETISKFGAARFLFGSPF